MLSNFPFLRGFSAPDAGAPVEYRCAEAHEIEPAVRLILASSFGDENQVREFVRLAIGQQSPAGGTFIAEQSKRLLSAVLSLVSPGRTMLLFVPPPQEHPFQRQTTQELIRAVCRRGAQNNVTLAQILLDPRQDQAEELLAACGFSRLAELLYMQADISRPMREPPMPPSLRWETYSPRTHNLFARAILSSYGQSLDCPALNGVRDIQDVVAGHRATGEFDPSHWFVLLQESTPAGVLLLSRVQHTDVLELVYLGLTPEARGHGLGDLLMRRAIATVAQARASRLSLAVDAGNTPALKLYWRHGLQTIGRKLAMLRNLHRP